MLCAHPTDRPIGTAADAPAAHHSLRDLFFFDMLERGIYLAARLTSTPNMRQRRSNWVGWGSKNTALGSS